MRDRSTRLRLASAPALAVAAAALALFGPLGAAPARGQQAEDPSPHSELSLGAGFSTVHPGEPLTVALRVTLDDAWHTYWINGGDAGLPLEVRWNLPDGFAAGPLQWPAPQLIPDPPLMSYGYEHELVLLAQITPPRKLGPGSIEISATADWLVCADICLPATGTTALTLPVSNAPAAMDEGWAGTIAAARDKLPRTPPGWSTRAWSAEPGFVVELVGEPGEALPAPYFFVDEVGVLDHAAPQRVERSGDTVRMLLPRSEFATEDPAALRGLIAADSRDPLAASWLVDFTLDPAAGTSVPGGLLAADAQRTGGVDALVPEGGRVLTGGGGAATGLWIALALAFLGGLALNLMPCVLPVLSVKILGFVQQGGTDPRSARRHGLAYGVGVLASFWLLAALLIGLRAAGEELGWGFQLQSPAIVAVLALLVFTLALNLLGVFEIGSSFTRLGGAGDGGGYRGSFLTGGLAVVVATPCTAPFMGAALGYALVQPPIAAFAVFTALAVGLAAPYVALASAPGLLRRLPRPGQWMVTFRQLLAFPMFATAVLLVWVFGKQLGVDAAAALLLSFSLVGLAAWLAGRPSAHGSRVVRLWAGAVATVALLVALAATRMPAQPGPTSARDSALEWEVFSPARVAELRALRRPVFVDFTAAWCLTCQVNERVAFSSRAVQSAFASADVALVRADWTNRDPVIADALRTLGRGGVPLYALYPSDGGDPEILGALLSPGQVVAAVDRAAGKRSP